jgi:hypothetical protein
MSGIGWKSSLQRPASPGRHGSPQQRRAAARVMHPCPENPSAEPLQRVPATDVELYVETRGRPPGGGRGGAGKE